MAETDLKDPKTLLSIIQIMVLIGTVVYVFAIMQADVAKNTQQLERHQEIIETQAERQRTTYVRQDVFAEQYQNILDKLERIEKKLND